MKTDNRIILSTLVAGLMCVAVTSVSALTEKEITSIDETLSAAPAGDLAVRAAELVKKATKKEKEATAVAVVKAAIAKNRVSALTVIASVVKAAPSTAAAVAVAAGKLLPDQVEAIAVATALVAPEEAEKIVAGLADVNPKAQESIASAVIAAVPNSEARVRRRVNDRNAAGETYTRTTTRINGSAFPAQPPVRRYASPGQDNAR